MNISIVGTKLCIQFEGKIDSTNAEQCKNEIFSYIDNNSIESIEVDCEKLIYISSAGLRLVLKMAKSCKDIVLFNVNSDNYNIFEMTGFTEMMKIVSAFRTVSIEGCEVIGQGALGKVYKLDDETIIKTYINPESLDNIKRERELARTALILGIPTCISYEVVKVGNGYGTVFEMLNAKSFAELFAKEDGNFDKYMDMYVGLLKTIHSKQSDHPLLADAKGKFLRRVDAIKPYIDLEKYNKIAKMAKEIEDSNIVLHGDFHVKNVMLQGNEVMLIDMDTLEHGNIIFEFGAMHETYIGYNLRTEEDQYFLGLSNAKCIEIYEAFIRKYFNNKNEKEIEDAMNKIALVGFVEMLSYALNDPAFFNYDKGITLYCNKINEVIDKVDNLKI